jgi:hypothetical protein
VFTAETTEDAEKDQRQNGHKKAQNTQKKTTDKAESGLKALRCVAQSVIL